MTIIIWPIIIITINYSHHFFFKALDMAHNQYRKVFIK